MKKNGLVTLLLLLIFIAGYSQSLKYEVHSTYSRPVTREKLNEAKTLNDINPGYPSSWITDYISSEIMVTSSGKEVKAIGTNGILNADQKSILNKVDIGTDVVVDIKYKHQNAANNKIDIETMHFAVTLVPLTEAEYQGGYQQMTQYLDENAISKISEKKSKQFPQAVVRFTVNEEGEIANAQMSKTSGDPKTDKLLLKAINKMPKWKPAEDSNGLKVKQEFEFSVRGPMAGGC